MVRIGGDGVGGGDGGGGERPAWLQRLMEETFFAGCGAHERRRKNEKNIFCLLCCLSFCPHCLPSHRSHPLLQPYTINNAKVIFLKQRTQSGRVQSGRGWKAGTPNVCFTCDRILQPPFHFCSLSCKVEHMVGQGEGLASIWMSSASQWEGLRVDSSGLLDEEEDEDQTADESHETFISEPHYYSSHDRTTGIGEPSVARYPPPPSSSSSTVVSGGGGGGDNGFTKRKKKGSGSSTATSTSDGGGSGGGKSRFLSVFSINNRRKGAPHRAPLS